MSQRPETGKGKNTMAKLDPKGKQNEKKQSFEERHACLICGKPGPETICEHCKIVVQAEALSEKRKIEKGGGGPR
jgi:hypothetical protein